MDFLEYSNSYIQCFKIGWWVLSKVLSLVKVSIFQSWLRPLNWLKINILSYFIKSEPLNALKNIQLLNNSIIFKVRNIHIWINFIKITYQMRNFWQIISKCQQMLIALILFIVFVECPLFFKKFNPSEFFFEFQPVRQPNLNWWNEKGHFEKQRSHV